MVKIGKIGINGRNKEFLFKSWNNIKKINFIPINIVFDNWTKIYEYTGYCELFDDIEEGGVIPKYLPCFKKDRIGRIRFVNLEKYD